LDTLKKLRAVLMPVTTLFFLMGADSLHSFRKWRQASELLFSAEFIIAARPGFRLTDLSEALPTGVQLAGSLESTPCVHSLLLNNNKGMQTRLHLLPNLREDISATDVRTALSEGNEEQEVVPAAVLQYIRKNNLYK
jgi:nicotinate-nucleotide adenylyltransferase